MNTPNAITPREVRKGKRTVKAKKEKKFEDYEKTKPQQLTMFSRFGLDSPYSNTIDFYDFIPKYVWGKQERTKVEKANKEVLPNLRREFECKTIPYTVVIKPASIEGKDGVDRDFYPSKREELVEDALRKIACESKNSVYLDGEASVTFTLYQLRKELKSKGHGYKIADIKEALYILSETHLEIATADGKAIMKSNIFQTMVLQTQEDWKGAGKKERAFVRFSPLVTKAIKHMKFRQLEYETAMSFKNYIARLFFKRLSHHYTQASISTLYTIMLSTLIRDFGLTQYSQLRDNLRELIQALEELKAKNVIAKYDIARTIDAQHHKKLIDVKFTILTTPQFNAEVKQANAKAVIPSSLIPVGESFP